MNQVKEAFYGKETLYMKGISKFFPGVRALNNVDLKLYNREILGLVGENGAGKSTLMKVLIGIERPDHGSIYLRGSKVDIKSAADAHHMGISMVFQDQALIPELTVLENIIVGHEEYFIKAGFIDWSKALNTAKDLLKLIGININPKSYIKELRIVDRQMVEIAKALLLQRYTENKPIIILDEPTSYLSEKEVEKLFGVLRSLKELGEIIFISHRLEEIMKITGRIVVLKDGEVVGETQTKTTKIEELQKLMVGRTFSKDYYCVNEQIEPDKEIVLKAKNLSSENLKEVSFSLKRKEILGFAGLIGCGKKIVLNVIFGVEQKKTGRILLYNDKTLKNTIKDAVYNGIGYIPSDRLREGILGNFSVLKNLTIVTIDKFVKSGLINLSNERNEAANQFRRMKIKAPSIDTQIINLSGGNQQKVIIGRWLMKGPSVLLMDEPTRGIDVGAKYEVYKILRGLVKDGMSIIVVSDELLELIGLCNRILVFKDGRITKEIYCKKEAKTNENEIIKYM